MYTPQINELPVQYQTTGRVRFTVCQLKSFNHSVVRVFSYIIICYIDCEKLDYLGSIILLSKERQQHLKIELSEAGVTSSVHVFHLVALSVSFTLF